MNRFYKLALSVTMVALMAVSTSAQWGNSGTPDWSWLHTTAAYTDTFYISTADDLAGLALVAKYGSCPECDVVQPGLTFHGKTIVLTNDIDISVYENWLPIGRSTIEWNEAAACLPINHPNSVPPIDRSVIKNCVINMLFAEAVGGSAFMGTFDGNGKTIRGLRMNYNYANDPEVDGQPMPTAVSVGLFGALDDATIKNLTVEADSIIVRGSHVTAGGVLAGYSRNSVITDCHVKGNLVGTLITAPYTEIKDFSLGGLIGSSKQDSIANSSFTGTAGASLYSSIPSAPSAVPFIFNDSRVGGLVGRSERSVISRSRATVALKGNGGNAVGGLVGENIGGEITQSSAAAKTVQETFFHTIQAHGSFLAFVNVGGLAGINREFDDFFCPENMECARAIPIPGTITQSYAVVDLKGSIGVGSSGERGKIGGLVAAADRGSVIRDSYARGTIITDDNKSIVGGFLGYLEYPMDMSVTRVTRTYAAVSIAGNAASKSGFGFAIAPIVGVPNYFFACYWDIDVSENPDDGVINSGAIGKTTEEMYQKNTFVGEVEIRAWDFDNVWRIKEGEDYPYLAWQDDIGNTSISNRQIARGANRNNFAPTVTIRGKTLNVRTLSSTQNLQVRLIDMRGRTMTRFDMKGGGTMSLNKISAGRYIVDMRDMETGRRFSSPIVVR